MTFLGAALDQVFGKQNEPDHLHPFGNNVADNLSSLGRGIHSKVLPEPDAAGEHQENGE